MKDSTLRYKLYEAAIETGLSVDQYHALMSEGVLDWIKDALTSVGAGKELAGDLKKLFANKKNQILYRQATDTIQKTVSDLFKAGADAGVDKDALKNWLVSGIEKMAQTAATKSENVSSDNKMTADAAEKLKPGEAVSANKPEAVSTLASAAAEAAGQDPKKSVAQAQENKVDVPKATQILAKAISVSSKVEVAKVSKIINFLIKNNHLLAEGQKISFLNNNSSQISEYRRWSEIAGLGLLNEEVSQEKKKKFEVVINDLRKSFKEEELSDDDIIKVITSLDDLDSIQVK